MKKNKKQTQHIIYCPYCGAKADLVRARELYGEKAHQPEEYMYVCRNYKKGCDAYVTTCRGTKKPRGFLANGDLRNKRIQTHHWIDKVIELGFSKNEVYEYLSTKIPFVKEKFHVGESSEYQCQTAISILQEMIALNEEKYKKARKNGGVV